MAEENSLRTVVERHFRVYDARAEKVHGSVVAQFYFVMFPQEEFDTRYENCRTELLAIDPELMVFHRRDGGEDAIVIARKPELPPKGIRMNIILFLLTLFTTIWAGASFWQSYTSDPSEPYRFADIWQTTNLLWGTITFAIPLMAILGLHETAHYMAAKRHGLRASLPFFIPFPPIAFPIGTLGAFISLRDPLPDRRALFDVGASGPLAGFIVAVPILLFGAALTADAAIEVPDLYRPTMDVEGLFELDEDTRGETTLTILEPSPGTRVLQVTASDDGDRKWSYRMSVTMKLTHADDETETLRETHRGSLQPGDATLRTLHLPTNVTEATIHFTWDDGLVQFGDPLLIEAIAPFFKNDDYLTHPLFFAGWVGLLVTGINLLPAGQLDGGHIARAVLGDRMQYAAYAAVGLLIYLAIQFQAWILMALFILLMGIQHPPPLNDRTHLDTKRKVLAGVTLLVLILTFVARPVIL